MTITALITHSGAFHADDLLAAAVLHTLYPDAPIVRTRDTHTIAQGVRNGALVFDVGMVYDHEQRLYDHHQHDRAVRDEQTENLDIPYSAFGLIWRHYGRAYLQAVHTPHPDDNIEALWEQVDRRFVARIDMADNGVVPPKEQGMQHPLSITRILETFGPDFDAGPGQEDAAFAQTLLIADAILRAKIRTIAADQRAFVQAKRAVRERVEPTWIELPTGMPYLGAIKQQKATEVLYAIMPSRDRSEWQISAVRQESGPLGCRKPFPANWAGLRGADLVAITGVDSAVFCHNGRFLTVASSREGALALLRQALAHTDSEASTSTS